MSEHAIIDMMDEEFTIPGELQAWTPEHRRIEAWPDKAKRQITVLEQRVLQLERLVHGLLNGSEDNGIDKP
jgi:hypothetical protein